jgi:transketolase
LLLARHLRHDPADPLWPDRDRLFCAAETDPPAGTTPTRLDAPPGVTAAAAVGAALAERMLAARFGRSLVDHRTWLLAGSMELAAGATHEAFAIAGGVPLGRLTVVAALQQADAPLARLTALGWAVRRVEAGDSAGFEAALAATSRAQKPTLVACLKDDATAIAAAEDANLNPRAAGARRAWLKRQRRHASAELFIRMQAGRLPQGGIEALAPHAAQPASSPAEAVRAALPRLAPAWPELAGLSTEGYFALPASSFAGRSVAWGGRDQAAAGGLLGMAVHGGLLPVAELSRAGAEACLPTLRLAASLNLRLLLLVREAEPLPEALLAALRATPGARLFRPGDAAEALECLALALRHVAAPSLLLLGADAAPAVPGAGARACARGGYVTHDMPHRDVTLIAGGTDMGVALAARRALEAAGIAAACVSLPCWQLFALQDAAYRDTVLGVAPRVGFEAGGGFGWDGILGPDGLFIDTNAPADHAAAILRRLREK